MITTTIVQRENESSSIEKLAAQRYLYSYAKNIFYIQIFVSVIALVLLSFAQLIFPKTDFTLIIATVSILAMIADNFLDSYIDNIKEKASKIQELFDTYVLNIPWNNILCGEKPEHHEICRYSSKKSAKKKIHKLKDWYDVEIDNVPEQAGKLIGQKTNCTYDASIRKKYKAVIWGIGIVTIVLISLLTIFSHATLYKIVLTVIFPAAPIIQWTQKNLMKVKKSIITLEQLNTLLNGSWIGLKNGDIINDDQNRKIQDGIFLNRKDSPLIPDFVYNSLRDDLESQMSYTARELVKEYNER